MKLVYEEAGYLGITDPDPFTLRTLDIMSKGKQKQEWSQNAAIVSMIYNTNCKKEDQKDAAFFNPMLSEDERHGRVCDNDAGMQALKAMLDMNLQARKEKGI